MKHLNDSLASRRPKTSPARAVHAAGVREKFSMNQLAAPIESVAELEATAQHILDVRARYPGKSMAWLYNPETMPADLREAHRLNDETVDRAYGYTGDKTDAARVSFLFDLHSKYIAEEKAREGHKKMKRNTRKEADRERSLAINMTASKAIRRAQMGYYYAGCCDNCISLKRQRSLRARASNGQPLWFCAAGRFEVEPGHYCNKWRHFRTGEVLAHVAAQEMKK